jgi:hypothetical protein
VSQFLASIDNREIATAFWIAAAIFVAALKPNIRSSMISVLRAFFVRKILLGVFLLFAYFSCVALVLAHIGMWTLSQLNTTLLWLGTSGILGLFSAPKVSENPKLISKAAKATFGVTMVLEFFVNLYQMPLVAEFVFVPLSVLLGALLAVSELDKKYRVASKFLTGVASLVGFGLFAYATWRTATDFEAVATMDTLRSFLLPIVYSFLLLPYVWAVAVYAAYEDVFIRLQFVAKNDTLHSYIKRSLIFKFHGNIKHVRAWLQAAWSRTFSTREDVDDSIRSVLDGASAV